MLSTDETGRARAADAYIQVAQKVGFTTDETHERATLPIRGEHPDGHSRTR